MATSSVSVRISGKKGKIKIEAKEGSTAADVVAEAAEQLGVYLDLTAVSFIVDGTEATGDTPVTGDQKVDAAPHAKLG